MKINRMDHVGIIVTNLETAIAFFLDFGLELTSQGEIQNPVASTITALPNAHCALAFMRTPDRHSSLELIQYFTPVDANGVQRLPANTLGLRHLCFNVDDLDGSVAKLQKRGAEPFSAIQNFENVYKLVYLRGPDNIILELAEEIK